MPAGRPSYEYDPELAALICERLSTSEMGLEDILDELRAIRGAEKITPSLATIYRWQEAHEEFRESSARARRFQAQVLHDRAQKVAREALIGSVVKTVVTDKGTETQMTTADNVERSKLIVQTLLKRAGQLDSKKYGDRTVIAGDPSAPLVIQREELVSKLLKSPTPGGNEESAT